MKATQNAIRYEYRVIGGVNAQIRFFFDNGSDTGSEPFDASDGEAYDDACNLFELKSESDRNRSEADSQRTAHLDSLRRFAEGLIADAIENHGGIITLESAKGKPEVHLLKLGEFEDRERRQIETILDAKADRDAASARANADTEVPEPPAQTEPAPRVDEKVEVKAEDAASGGDDGTVKTRSDDGDRVEHAPVEDRSDADGDGEDSALDASGGGDHDEEDGEVPIELLDNTVATGNERASAPPA